MDDRDIPPRYAIDYRAFADLNLGAKDKTTLCNAHLDGDVVKIDCLRSWSSASGRDEITAEACEVMKGYGVQSAPSDRVAGDFVRGEFHRYGIALEQEAEPKATLYLALLAAVNRRGVEIPNNPTLTRQLRLLERRHRPSGKDWIDLPRGASEEESNVLAGVIWALTAVEPIEELAWINLYRAQDGMIREAAKVARNVIDAIERRRHAQEARELGVDPDDYRASVIAPKPELAGKGGWFLSFRPERDDESGDMGFEIISVGGGEPEGDRYPTIDEGLRAVIDGVRSR